MRRLARALLLPAGLALGLLLFWALFPGLPGRLLLDRLSARAPFPVDAASAALHPDLDFVLRGLALGGEELRVTCERATLDPEIRHTLAGNMALHFDAAGMLLRGFHALDGGRAPFALPLGGLTGRAESSPRASLALQATPLSGRLRVALKGDPSSRRGGVEFSGEGFDLASLGVAAPLLPARVNAKVTSLAGTFALDGGTAAGDLRFAIGQGFLETLVATSPVLLEPSGFGEIPAQLGLTNDLASRFATITGEAALAGDGTVRFSCGVLSEHYHLDLSGAVDRARVLDGRLTLRLEPATLARNSLGIDFRGEPFRIYGFFRGPLGGEIVSAWDADKEALLRAAADRMRERFRGLLPFPR